MSFPGSTNVTPHESNTLNRYVAGPLETHTPPVDEEPLEAVRVDAGASRSTEGEFVPTIYVASSF